MKVEIYGAEWCTYCKQAVELCKINQVDCEYIDIDQSGELKNLENRLGSKVRSVPQIFLDGSHLTNGFSSLKQYFDKKVN
jgi:glutaredoxin